MKNNTANKLKEEFFFQSPLKITFSRNSKRKKSKREKYDFYPSPEEVTEDLLKEEDFTGTVWEPACGTGNISKVFESKGKKVLSTDLIIRGYGKGGVNFLKDKHAGKFGKQDNIVTNPPFKYAKEFVEQSKKYARKKIALFLRTSFLEGKCRYEMFQDKKFALKFVYQFSRRVTIYKSGKRPKNSGSGTMAFAWFVWVKGYKGLPMVKWIK
jgi:hypothetical protein